MHILEKIAESIFFKDLVAKINKIIDNSNELGSKTEILNDNKASKTELTAELSTTMLSHNTDETAHNDVRLLIKGLTDRLNALANSDDETLDQMGEIVTYIKANKSLIESVTTSKVNVSDIIDNLTTKAADKPLSAAQGLVLNQLIRALWDAKNSGNLDGRTPVKGVDYWTPEEVEQMNLDSENFIVNELAKRGQLKPEFANSIEECTDTSKLYVLPDGFIYAYMTYPSPVGASGYVTDWTSTGHAFVPADYEARILELEKGLPQKAAEELSALKDNCANAIKKTVSGEAVAVHDVSSLEHNIPVRLSSKNLLGEHSELDHVSYENGLYTHTRYNANTLEFRVAAENYNEYGNLIMSKSFSTNCTDGVGRYSVTLTVGFSIGKLKCSMGNNLDGHETLVYYDVELNPGTYTLSFDLIDNSRTNTSWANIMLEKGDVATPYVPCTDVNNVTLTQYHKNICDISSFSAKGLASPNELDCTDWDSGTKIIVQEDGHSIKFEQSKAPSSTVSFANGYLGIILNPTIPLGSKAVFSFTLSMNHSIVPGTTNKEFPTSRKVLFFTNDNKGKVVILKSGRNSIVIDDWARSKDNRTRNGVSFYINGLSGIMSDFQLELGDTATDYEPCTPESYSRTVNGEATLSSIHPEMSLLPNIQGAIMEFTYNQDISMVLAAKAQTNHSHSQYLTKNNPVATGSFSLGRKTGTTVGTDSFAVGKDVTASGVNSSASGQETQAIGKNSFSIGHATQAVGNNSFASGAETKALSTYTFAAGLLAKAGSKAFKVSSKMDIPTDYGFVASGFVVDSMTGLPEAFEATAAQGQQLIYIAYLADTEYYEVGTIVDISSMPNTIIGGGYSTTSPKTDLEKALIPSTDSYLLILGCPELGDVELGLAAFAEGVDTRAQHFGSHAEGVSSIAVGQGAHAEGILTRAGHFGAHAEGFSTMAAGKYSHAGGSESQASGDNSFAHGEKVIASVKNQSVVGQYNKEDPDALLIVGNGTDDNHRHNAMAIKKNGDIVAPNIANALKGTASGEAIAISDASPIEHEMVVKVTSKNLIPFPYTDSTAERDGISFTVNDDRSIAISGTPSSSMDFIIADATSDIRLEHGVTYTLSGGNFTFTNPLGEEQTDSIRLRYQESNGTIRGVTSGESFVWNNNYVLIEITLSIWSDGCRYDTIVPAPQLEKGITATAYTPHIEDISTAKVKKYGKNLIDINNPTLFNSATYEVTDNIITLTKIESSYYPSIYFVIGKYSEFVGKTITFSCTLTSDTGTNNTSNIMYICGSQGNNRSKFTVKTGHPTVGTLTEVTATIPENTDAENLVVRLYMQRLADVGEVAIIKDIQVEIGDTATPYESHIEPIEYPVSADGMVDGVTPVYPTTTLMTDTNGVVIDCTYNRDINKAFEQLYYAILSMGGNV